MKHSKSSKQSYNICISGKKDGELGTYLFDSVLFSCVLCDELLHLCDHLSYYSNRIFPCFDFLLFASVNDGSLHFLVLGGDVHVLLPVTSTMRTGWPAFKGGTILQ